MSISMDTVEAFEWLPYWGELPPQLIGADVPGIAVDAEDRVYVLSRSMRPIVVLSDEGEFIDSWGAGNFQRPHGIHVAPDHSIWCVDDEGHSVHQYSPDGQLLSQIDSTASPGATGYVPGFPHTVQRSAGPFCYPTDVAHDGSEGGTWVTDGYGNARLHRFGPDHELLSSWGEPGSEPGQFVIPHGVTRTSGGQLLIADRENERIQVFESTGVVTSIWAGVHCPNKVAESPDGSFVVAELGRVVQGPPGQPTVVADALPARVTIRDRDGQIQHVLRPPEEFGGDEFFAPHGLAVDSRGDIYIGEVRSAYSGGLAEAGSLRLHKIRRAKPR